ncbi:unnamed protein product, partial [Mesorhabditis belari]|uniref:Nose resistant-to-fluoxetine protein N-terminal domain-containing protein n=1 Tax=Mesorhabditis belari TaxID=2138241 RepID=A0AAF3E8M1_9BILA
MQVLLALFSILVQLNEVDMCFLCPLREPPRPRPLDQFQLPTFPKMPSTDQVPPLCEYAKKLPIEGACQKGFQKLLCSAEKFTSTLLNGCPGSDQPKQCSNCSREKADNTWLISWFDSLGKPPSGISDGNYYWLGDYEICHDLRIQKRFRGQYCRVELEIPDAQVESGCPQTDPLAIILGVCFPAECTTEELAVVAEFISPYSSHVDCEVHVEWSLSAKIFLLVTCLWTLLILVCTGLHIRDPDLPLALYCLSLKVNGARALSTKRDYNLHAQQGLEFITFFALIIGMVYNFMLPYIENVAFAFDGVAVAPMHLVNNYSYHIDGLLALTSFFTTSLLMGHIVSLKDIISAIVRKLVRFMPSYIFIVAFMSVVFANVGSGPMWIHGDTVQRCERSWWKNILLINNFFGVRETCVDFGHVISLEAQCFALLIILIYFANHHRIAAQVLAGVFASISIIVSFYLVLTNALPPAPMLTTEPVDSSKTEFLLSSVLIAFVPRLSAYMIGFIYYFYFNMEEIEESHYVDDPNQKAEKTHHNGKTLSLLLMGLTAFLMAGVAFSMLPYATTYSGAQWWLATYAALHRPVWAFAIVSLLWLCQNKNFSELNSFLSWRLFSPLSKLTYQALIIAEPLILYFFSALHRPSHATHWSTLYAAVSTAAVSYLFALLIDIFLARPLRNILYSRSIHRRRYTIPGRSNSLRTGI